MADFAVLFPQDGRSLMESPSCQILKMQVARYKCLYLQVRQGDAVKIEQYNLKYRLSLMSE